MQRPNNDVYMDDRPGIPFKCPVYNPDVENYEIVEKRDFFRERPEEDGFIRNGYISLTEPNLSDYMCDAIICVLTDLLERRPLNQYVLSSAYQLIEIINAFKDTIRDLSLSNVFFDEQRNDDEEKQKLVLSLSEELSDEFIKLVREMRW